MSPQAATAPQSAAQRQIARADALERERAATLKKIDANRKYLRLMAENDELSDQELNWLDDFYPAREKDNKRDQDELERTRVAKEAAIAGKSSFDLYK